MDAMIGLPLEEYHRSVRIMPATTGVEDIQSILFDNGWRFLVALSDYMYNNPLRRACYKELGQVSWGSWYDPFHQKYFCAVCVCVCVCVYVCVCVCVRGWG